MRPNSPYKVSTDTPADHHQTIRLNQAASRIKQDSGGRIEIRVFDNSVLANSQNAVVQTRAGAIEMCTNFDLTLGESLPAASVTGIPFVFANAEEGIRAMAGPLGKYVHGQLGKLNLRGFDRSWNLGFRQVVNRLHPIYNVEDIRGLTRPCR